MRFAMSKQKDSEDLLRVGSGTVMGEMMRQYWIPAVMSSELERDGAPLRLMLLGEKLIAFRDSSGRVGIMDHRCPHRCASLFLGRNEENGIRCVYHGWKYDAEGNCVDMPNAPPHQDFKDKVKAKAYKVTERNGLIWVYMGSRQEAPPLPAIEASLLREAELQISFVQRECNWLQALEGDIDTSHFGFLHTGSVQPEDAAPDSLLRWTLANRAPEYHVTDTSYGTMYCAYRAAEAGQTYWRFANFLFPFWTQTPQGPFDRVNTRAWVPMDDTHTMFVSLSWRRSPPSMRPLKNGQMVPGSRLGFDCLPNTTDWYGRWRLTQNPSNDWMIDREAQKSGDTYTGIPSIHGQDQAVTESMGGITDHGFENLGPSDIMIARTRRRLLRAARAFAKDGTVPPCVDDPGIYTAVRSGDFLADGKIAWRDAYEMQMRVAVRPLAQAAE
jgi:phenylpropionate dioxygenase-like ring-hydroxylating dioxygenase large terminal subunit